MYEQYERQSEKGNIPKADFYRIQTERMRLQSEWAAIETEENTLMQKLQIFTNLPHLTDGQILFSKKTDFGLSSKLPITLQETITKQIGRASCRERLYSTISGVLASEKEGRTNEP